MSDKAKLIKRRHVLALVPAENLAQICKEHEVKSVWSGGDFRRKALLDNWSDGIGNDVIKVIWGMIK